MITWIQKYLQHHFRTVFILVLVGTILGLVFSINASGGLGNAEGRKLQSRRFFDLDLGTTEGQQRLLGDANLSLTLRRGVASPADERLVQYAELRYAALQLAEQFQLPAPSSDEISAYVKSLGAFTDPLTGQFSASRYAEFRDSLKMPGAQVTEADVSRVLADDLRASHVQTLLGGPGYVLGSDVRVALELADSSWTVTLATVDLASFAPTITPSDADLEKYFTTNATRYQVPVHVRADAIEFSADPYLAKVTFSDKEVRAYYDVDPKRFPAPAAPPLLAKPDTPATPANADADFAAVRPAVEAALRHDKAARLAQKVAADFADKLYNEKIKPEAIAAHLNGQATLRPVAPFDLRNPPADLGGTKASPEAFKLAGDHLYSDAILTDRGAVVLAWRESIPSRPSTYAEVKDRVTKDYTAAEKSRLSSELGKTIRTHLESSLKSGATFDKAVADAATATSVKLEAKSYPAFTLREHQTARTSDIYLDAALPELATLKKGQVSEMVTARDTMDAGAPEKGVLLYVADKKLPDLSPSGAEFANARTLMAAEMARYAGGASLSEIVQKELAKSAPPAATP